MSEVVDLSRTTVAGNLLDCEETSSYVEVYTYIYIYIVRSSFREFSFVSAPSSFENIMNSLCYLHAIYSLKF